MFAQYKGISDRTFHSYQVIQCALLSPAAALHITEEPIYFHKIHQSLIYHPLHEFTNTAGWHNGAIIATVAMVFTRLMNWYNYLQCSTVEENRMSAITG